MESDMLSKISSKTAKSMAHELRVAYLNDKAVFNKLGLESRLKRMLEKYKIGCYHLTVSEEKQGYIKVVLNLFATEVVFRIFYNSYNVLGISAALVKTEIL